MYIQRPEGWQPNAHTWRACRPRQSRVRPRGWTANPELEPSLRLLLEEQQYSAVDVAAMFGISRERIRQYCERFGIEQRGKNRGEHTRVWDDERNTFRPVRPDEYRTAMSAIPRQRKRQEQAARVAARRAKIVAAIHACVARLERTPTAVEVWEEVSGTSRDTWPSKTQQGYASGWLTGAWVTYRPRSRKGVMAEIWAAAGVTPRPRGGAGHLNPARRNRRTHCKRGHPLEGDNIRFLNAGRNRVCRVCDNTRRLAQYYRRKAKRASGV